MKRKNNGFTLIEVLATIAIIAVVTLIATITYSKVRTNILKREYKNLKALIETAGVKYSSKTGIDTFYVLELIEQGYLEPDDDSNNIYDPRDGHPLNCHEVKVDADEKGNYKAELKSTEHKVNDGCDPNRGHPKSIDMTLLIHSTGINYLTSTNASEVGQISKTKTTKPKTVYDSINIVIDGTNRWTNKQLDITANILAQSGYIPYYYDINGAKYVWNKNTDTTTTEPNRSYTTNFVEFYNDDFYLDLYTKDGKHLQTSKPIKFDQQKPALYGELTAYGNPLDETRWTATKTLIIYATDKNGVGLDRVYAGSRPCTDLLYDPKMGTKAVSNKTVHYHTVDDLETGIDGNNGDINICAVDKLGNLAEDRFTITKLDVTPPRCQKNMKAKRSDDVIDEDKEYQWSERTIRQYCYDNNMINGKTVIGSGCTATYVEKSWSTTTRVGYIRIKDNVGHTTDCPVNVYVDRTAPICSKATGSGGNTSGVGSPTNWDMSDRTITQYCADDHVGCKSSSYTKSWHKDLGTDSSSIITTDKIRIYDKVKKCSQKSTINSNCSNYNSIKGTAENDTNYNNYRDCTEGVYIDHVPPTGGIRHDEGHILTYAKMYCNDDCNGSCSSYSGINVFRAKVGNSTKENNSGSDLKFKFDSAGTYPYQYTCKDNAGNVTNDTGNYRSTPYTGNIDSHGGNCQYEGKQCTKSKWRVWDGMTGCGSLNYDCYCEDMPCSSKTNQGMYDTCCLSGEDRNYGCKNWSSTKTNLEGKSVQVVNPTTEYPFKEYVVYNGEDYFIPSYEEPSAVIRDIDTDEIIGYKYAYKCLNYNCYADHPTTSRPMFYVCGTNGDYDGRDAEAFYYEIQG